MLIRYVPEAYAMLIAAWALLGLIFSHWFGEESGVKGLLTSTLTLTTASWILWLLWEQDPCTCSPCPYPWVVFLGDCMAVFLVVAIPSILMASANSHVKRMME